MTRFTDTSSTLVSPEQLASLMGTEPLVIIDTRDADTYAGSNYGNGGGVDTDPLPSHGQTHSLALNLPPLGVLILKPN